MTDRVAIVGARRHPNLDLVREYVRSLPPGTVVISGGAEGVDSVAVEEARACGLYVVEHWPGQPTTINFGPHLTRRDELFLRNTYVVVDCTRLTAFPDGSKGGTWDSIKQAARFRRPVEIRYADGRVETKGGGR